MFKHGAAVYMRQQTETFRKIAGLAEALEKIYAKTEKQFIFQIDEWDCNMREWQKSEELQKQYLDFLRNLLKNRV